MSAGLAQVIVGVPLITVSCPDASTKFEPQPVAVPLTVKLRGDDPIAVGVMVSVVLSLELFPALRVTVWLANEDVALAGAVCIVRLTLQAPFDPQFTVTVY